MAMQMTSEQLMSFLKQHFPQVADNFTVRISDEGRSVEMPVNDKHLRPGGTVSGPSMFALADVAFYLAILRKIGPEGLTVTTSATINFMRKPGWNRWWPSRRFISLAGIWLWEMC